VGDGLSGLAAQFSDESALEVCVHVTRYTNRRLYFFSFLTLEMLMVLKILAVTLCYFSFTGSIVFFMHVLYVC